MKNLGENISNLRRKAEMTQEDLSIKMNVTAQAVSKWETGISLPDIETLIRLAEIFGVSLDELVNGKGHITEVKSADSEKIEKRILLISVNENETSITVRVPVALLIKAEESGNLSALVGDASAGPVESVMELIKSGTVGLLTEVHNGDTDVLIKVEDYEG